MDGSIRTFIAIELSEEIKNAIKLSQDSLKKSNNKIKWVKPENAHLTLKFLGDVNVDKIGIITKILEECCKRYGPLDLELTVLGSFPPGKRPRIIYLGVTDNGDKIKNLSLLIEDKLTSLGFEKETREFKAHITIGRIRFIKDSKSLNEDIENKHLEQIKQIINTVSLFKSTLHPDGPTYEKISDISLI